MQASGLVFMAAVLLAGCTPRIEYAVENAGTKDLTDVLVVSDSGHRFLHGTLIPKTHSSFSGGEKIKGQNKFTLSWTDGSGAKRRADVELSDDELKNQKVRMLRITDSMTVEKSWLLEK